MAFSQPPRRIGRSRRTPDMQHGARKRTNWQREGVRLVHGEAAGKDLVLSRSLTLAPDVDSGGWDGAADARGN